MLIESSYRVDLHDAASNASRHVGTSNVVSTTKFTVANFLFKSLFLQLRKATNLYFVLSTVISLIPQITSIRADSQVLSLLFVLLVGLIRDGVEDFARFKADQQVNCRLYCVVDAAGTVAVKQAQQLRVGDLVELRSDEHVPADLLLLSSSSAGGECFVETASLDGESNLKRRVACSATAALASTREGAAELRGTLTVSPPNCDLYSFPQARLLVDGETSVISSDQLLQRGVVVRNTTWARALVVFCGRDTKLSLNARAPPSKISTLELRQNRVVACVFAFKLLVVAILTVCAGVWPAASANGGSPLDLVATFFSFFTIFSFLIPISLAVTLEITKAVQVLFMRWDAITPKAANLSDELPLVRWVFADKTGTLTQNRMLFAKCSVRAFVLTVGDTRALQNALQYADEFPVLLTPAMVASAKRSFISASKSEIRNFLRCMSLCHTVVATHADGGGGDVDYSGASPDEVALCRAAAQNGFAFVGGTETQSVLRVQRDDETWIEETFERLAVLEFSSDRRRMSVIVRRPDGVVELLTKGADFILSQLLRAGTPTTLKKATDADLSEFAQAGLRTLMLARRELDAAFCADWVRRWHDARVRLDAGREEALANLMSEIEQDLELVGCTAIEDALQERVPETIDYLLRANVRVWMITGDKQETAISVGFASKLLKRDAPLLSLNATTPETLELLLDEALRQYGAGKMRYEIGDPAQPTDHLALVIDGTTLGFALNDHCSQAFLKLALRAQVVICNRVTPLQKARVVELIKHNSDDVTLSIGDGANDVSMIQAAHVGVGIMGVEGGQAALAADFALRDFSQLQRLISVHGRFSLIRSAGLVNFFLYKNAALVLAQAFFALHSAFSATSLFDSWTLMLYNLIYTSLTGVVVAMFEKDVPESTIDLEPALLRDVQDGKQFTYGTAARSVALGCAHAAALYFGAVLAMGEAVSREELGAVVATGAIVAVNLVLLLQTSTINAIVAACFAASIGSVFAVSATISWLDGELRGAFEVALASAEFWLYFCLAVTVCSLPTLTSRFIQARRRVRNEPRRFTRRSKHKDDDDDDAPRVVELDAVYASADSSVASSPAISRTSSTVRRATSRLSTIDFDLENSTTLRRPTSSRVSVVAE
jgi:phospholipid-translocating P-type ATPase (flippase)